MFEPGYYKINYRALRLREMVRWYGWSSGVWGWLKTRFMPISRTGRWMPGLWAENECEAEDLSPDFWQATKPHRADFEKLGFVQCHLSKATKKSGKVLDGSIRDCGGIFYLDPTGCYFGQLIYSRSCLAIKGHEPINIVIAFTAVLGQESLSCTNHKLAFDSQNPGEVIRFNSYDVLAIYNLFRKELGQRPHAPRPFADLGSLRQWFDARQIRNFEDRVRRGLFVRMTEQEVAAWWAERQRYPAGRVPPSARRRFRLDLMPTTLALILLVWLIIYRHRHIPESVYGKSIAANTIDYQGQEFKLSRSYTNYDDYKDDPNNLDTNELGRIEQTMEAVKVPSSFKDHKAFITFMIELEFPGYGLSDGRGKTDDGSTLEVASVEIPQRDKDRVVLVRTEPGGGLKLVDDFIYTDEDTNDISHVRLDHQQLEYFDQAGRLVRKKSL
jgi:hypothetical protein